LHVLQEGLPDVLPLEHCYLGWRESLVPPAKLVKACAGIPHMTAGQQIAAALAAEFALRDAWEATAWH
jgi:hypothetical protein